MKQATLHLGAVVLTCLVLGGGVLGATTEPFAPKIGESTLRMGDQTIRARASWSRSGSIHFMGDVSISVDGRHLVARRDGKTAWEADAEGDCRLVWLTSDRGRAFLAAVASGEQSPAPTKDHVRVIDVASGKWQPALTLTQGAKPAAGTAVVIDAIAANGGVVVAAPTADGMLVEFFGQIETGIASVPTWELAIPRTERSGEPRDAALLLASAYPDRARAGTTAITAIGRHIVVCPGPREPIVSLDVSNGKIEWTLARPWEYQRGFVGPSVWSHVLGRFGKDELNPEQEDVKAREEFDARCYGTILAGPAASADARHLFIAMGKGPIDEWTNYLMEPSMLEVRDDGQVVAVSSMPRRPLGKFYACRAGEVVWACQGNALACMRQTGESLDVGMPGGFDRVCELQWFHRYEGEEAKGGWVYSPGLEGVVAFDGDRAFMGTGGMRILKEFDRTILMTIFAIDLRDGSGKSMTLEVPFVGNAPRPSSNYRSDGHGFRSSGPFLMGVTALHAGGGVLLVTVGEEGKATVLEFAIDGVGGPAGAK